MNWTLYERNLRTPLRNNLRVYVAKENLMRRDRDEDRFSYQGYDLHPSTHCVRLTGVDDRLSTLCSRLMERVHGLVSEQRDRLVVVMVKVFRSPCCPSALLGCQRPSAPTTAENK